MVQLKVAEADEGRRFAWRDALAFVRAVPAMAWRRDHRVSWHSFAGLSAINPHQLPRLQHFAASDGGQIAYRSYGSALGAQLVLVHGSACFGDQLHRLADHIAGSGRFRVHTLDLRGHGASSPATACPDQFCRDIGEFVASLHRSGPQRSIFLGGHSAGGGLVLNALSSPYVEGVCGALLLAPFLGIDSKTVRPLFGGWLLRVRLFRLGWIMLANLCGTTRFNRLPVAEFNTEACLHDPRFARQWGFSSVFGFGPGSSRKDRSRLASLSIKLIAGGRDECFQPEHYAEAIERIAPGAGTSILPGLGHWDVLTNPAALDACADWLYAQVPATADLATEKAYDWHARTG